MRAALGPGTTLARAEAVLESFDGRFYVLRVTVLNGEKELGRGNFAKIPNGMPGVETRLHLMFEGVKKGRISLNRFVEITSTAPAKIFGLYGKKGTIAVGADADVVVWDRNPLSAFARAERVYDEGVVAFDQKTGPATFSDFEAAAPPGITSRPATLRGSRAAARADAARAARCA